MRQQDLYIALDWLKPALDETCDDIIQQLKQLHDTAEGKETLVAVSELLHQISGTLTLTELNEFLVLSETLEDFCHFLYQKQRPSNEIRDLHQAVSVLKFELNELQKTKKKHSGLLYQRANYLRQIMGKARLGQDVQHTVNLQSLLPAKADDELSDAVKTESVEKEVLDKDALNTLQQAWRLSTLNLIKQTESTVLSGDTAEAELDKLTKAANYVYEGSQSLAKKALWHVASQWLQSLQLNSDIRVSAFASKLNDLDPYVLQEPDNQVAETLIVDMLIHLIGLEKITQQASSSIKHFSPQSAQGQSSRILDSVAAIIDTAINDVSATPQKTSQRLTEATWLLEIGGWKLHLQFAQQVIDELRSLSFDSRNTEQLDSITQQLSELKRAISSTQSQLKTQVQSVEDMDSDKKVVLHAARVDLEEIKDTFNAYCMSKRLDELQAVPEKLDRLHQGFQTLGLEEPTLLIVRIDNLFQKILSTAALKVLGWSEIDAIAETLSSLEYYFDRLAQQFQDDSALKRAADSLTVAEELLMVNISSPVSANSIASRAKIIDYKTTHYDDSGEVGGTQSEIEQVQPDAEVYDLSLDDGDIHIDDLGDYTGANITALTAADLADERQTEQTPTADAVIPHATDASRKDNLIDNPQSANTMSTHTATDELLQDPLLSQAELAQSDEVLKARLVMTEDDFSQDDEIRDIYVEEAEEVLDHIHRYLPLWEADTTDLAPLTEIRRCFHTLKGSGRMVGAYKAGEVAWAIENMLNRVLENSLKPTDDLVRVVKQVVALMPSFVEDFAQRQTPKHNPVVPIVRANNLIAGKPVDTGLVNDVVDDADTTAETGSQNIDNQVAENRVVVQDALNSERLDMLDKDDAFSLQDDVTEGALTGDFQAVGTHASTVDDGADFEFDDFDDLESLQVDDVNEDVVNTQVVDAPSEANIAAVIVDDSHDAVSVDAENTADTVLDDEASQHEEENAGPSDELQTWINTVVPPIADDLNGSDDIKEIFVEEAGEVLEHIDSKLPIWRNDLNDKATLADIRRGFHTLKGSGRMVGANKIGELAWYIEDMLNRVIDGAVTANEDIVRIVDATTGIVPSMVENYAQSRVDDKHVLPLMAVAKSYIQKSGIDPTEAIALTVGQGVAEQIDAAAQPQVEVTADVALNENTQNDVAPISESVDSADVSFDTIADITEADVVANENEPEAATDVVLGNTSDDVDTVVNPVDEFSFDLDDMDADETSEMLTGSTASFGAANITTDTDVLNDVDEFDEFDFDLPDNDDGSVVESNTHTASGTLVAGGIAAAAASASLLQGEQASVAEDETDDFDFDLPFESETSSGQVDNDIDAEPLEVGHVPGAAMASVEESPVFDVTDAPVLTETEIEADVADSDVPAEPDSENLDTSHNESNVTEHSIREVFIEEATALVAEIKAFADQNPNGGDVNNEVIRALHTLRGSTAMSGLDVLRDINMSMEIAYRHFMDNRIDLTEQHIGLLHELCVRSTKHLEDYKQGNQTFEEPVDTDLIQRINALTASDDDMASQSHSVHVADLVELDIEDVLDAEWELESKLLAGDPANYVTAMITQIKRLQAHVEHLPVMHELLEKLSGLYTYIQVKPELTSEDYLIDALLAGHQNVTTMFDAIAASQRVTCNDGLIQQFADVELLLNEDYDLDVEAPTDSNTAVSDEAVADKTDEFAFDADMAFSHALIGDRVIEDVNAESPVLDNVATETVTGQTEAGDDVDCVENNIENIDIESSSEAQDDASVEQPVSADTEVEATETSVTTNANDVDDTDTLPAVTSQTETQEAEAQETAYEGDFEPELLEIFLEEAEEIALDIDAAMTTWAGDTTNLAALGELQRHLHTIKGGARMVGVSSIGNLTHEAETVYELLTAEKITGSPQLVRFMRHIQDTVSLQVDELRVQGRSFHAADELDAITAFAQSHDENILEQFFVGQTTELPAIHVETLGHDAELATDEVSEVNDEEMADVAADNTSHDLNNVPSEAKTAQEAPEHRIDLASVRHAINTTVQANTWDADTQPDAEMLDIFLEEANEIVEASSGMLHKWLADTRQLEHLHALQRELHTLKGGARMAGVASLGDLAHEMEFIYEDLALGRKHATPEIAKVLSQSHDWLADAVHVLEEGNEPAQPDVLITPLQAYMKDADGFDLSQFVSQSSADLAALATEEEVVAEPASEQTEQLADDSKVDAPVEDAVDSQVDKDDSNATSTQLQSQPQPATEESTLAKQTQGKTLQELLEQQDPNKQQRTFELPDMTGNFTADDGQQNSNEMIRISSALMESLINLSGEAAINRGRVEVSNTSLTNNIEEMGATVQRLADQLRRMDIELEAQILAQYEGELSQYEDFDPLEMDQYSALNQLSKSLAESASDLLDIKSTMLDRTRETEGLLLQQSRIQTELQEGLMNSRLVPFSRLSSRLQRIIRQTANELGKSVELNIVNANNEVDRTVLDRITSPLEHMLRNAVDHGIELPSDRQKDGKTATGHITLAVKREGGEIVITVTDDGKGINVDAVSKKAIERGLIQNQELSDVDIMQYIFNAGLSTATKVTQISGRGVGMDVVQSEIKQLGGVISVDSEQGKGSTFTMRLPLTVAVADALVVRSADRHYAIPLVQIERIERVSFDDIKAYYQSEDDMLKVGDSEYRLRYLNTLLNGSPFSDFSQAAGSIPVIIVKTAAGPKQAIQVDELSGSRTEIVVKPLGNQLSKTQGISAATILGDGSVMLILDMLALIRQAPVEKQVIDLSDAVVETQQTSSKTEVMVVDDSVTVRKVTSRLLERNGFVVHTAKDGVDAIEKLQEITPDVMLLDIEMPRMDGFEVASQVRNNNRLKEVPIIMITSRTGEKHRERAFELGVNCYMGKPFQEPELLENIDGVLNQVSLDV